MTRTTISAGSIDCPDLYLYAHIAPDAIRAQALAARGQDAIVTLYNGAGTSAYAGFLEGGTWPAYLSALERKLGKRFRKTCLTTWSAGSEAAKRVCADGIARAGEARWPDAIVMLDGLYARKPSGSKPGDGRVAWDDGLDGIARYACAAARGERTLVILHSRIPTPYGSSKECAEAIVARVEDELGARLEPGPTPAELGPAAEHLALGNLHVVEFAGAGAAEHVRQAHLFDECWRLWVRWAGERDEPEEPVTTPTPTRSLPELALALSLAKAAAGEGESPPGSNRVDPIYWSGCTRVVQGEERLVKVTVGPWCAAGFQWATYEAARRLGLIHGRDADAWLSGPIPHGKRVAVWELQKDFTLRGLFRPAALVRSGGYEPRPGDAVLLDRAGGPGGGFGHVARFVRDIGGGRYEAVGANEEVPGDPTDRWRVRERSWADPGFRGLGSFPRDGEGAPLKNPALAALPPALHESIAAASAEWCARERVKAPA